MSKQIKKNDYMCHKCEKTFINDKTLNLHVKTAECIKSKKVEFKCEFCEKIFSSKQMLKYHWSVCLDKKIKTVEDKYEEIISNLKQEYECKLLGICEPSKNCEKACKYANGVDKNGSPINCTKKYNYKK